MNIGDIVMDEYHCVHLTQQGLQITESTLDKHGLLQNLGVPSEVAAGDACAIAHNIGPETYSALKQQLNERQGSV